MTESDSKSTEESQQALESRAIANTPGSGVEMAAGQPQPQPDGEGTRQLRKFQSMANQSRQVRQLQAMQSLANQNQGGSRQPRQLKPASAQPPSQLPVVQRVLSDLVLTNLGQTVLPLFTTEPGNLRATLEVAYAAADDATNEAALQKACEDAMMLVLAQLDPRVQLALALDAGFLEKLISLSEKIWQDSRLATQIKTRLKQGLPAPTDVEVGEVSQLSAVLPHVLWDEASLLTADAVRAAARKPTLDEAVDGIAGAANIKRVQRAFLQFHPPAEMETAPLPARGTLRAEINQDVEADPIPPMDLSMLPEVEREPILKANAAMRADSLVTLRQGTVVFLSLIQTIPTHYFIQANGQSYYVPQASVTPSAEPDTGPLGGGEAVPLFGVDGPQPDDIGQQALGDCFLLAPIGSIAKQNPGFLREMVQPREENRFAVRFFRKVASGGYTTYAPEWVEVDDRVYVDAEGAPIYAKGNKALWPGIVEKAYAVFKGGGYERIGGGDSPGNALEIITGKPSESVAPGGAAAEGILGSKQYSDGARALFRKIQNGVASGKFMALGTDKWGGSGTGVSGGENTTDVPGLASTHAYSIVGAKGDPDSDDALYVTIRNPWGHFGRAYERTGPFWSKRTTAREQDAGTFDLELSDLMRYAQSVDFNPG